MRVTVIALSVLAAIALLFAGAVFGLNGAQWTWWRWAAWAGAAVVAGGAVALCLPHATRRRHARGAAWPAAAWLGVLLVVASLTVMARRYSDPYAGPLFWPHLLAVAAFAGLVLADAGLVRYGLRDDPVGARSGPHDEPGC